jgi:hypothetical protein
MSTAPAQQPSGLRIFGKALLWALGGFFLAPVTMFVVGMILNSFNPVCGTPGDSGGCEMGLAVMAIGSVVPGALIGFGLGLWRGLLQRKQTSPI